jgi:hypothetical protein
VRERAERGNRCWIRLDARGKRSTISAVAIARSEQPPYLDLNDDRSRSPPP